MKLRQNVNLGEAFEKLKEALIKSGERIKHDEEQTLLDKACQYAEAYGHLSGIVKGMLTKCTDTTFTELDVREENQNNNLN